MDYAKMLRFHIEKDAAATLATIEVPIAEGSRFGIVGVDEADRVVGFEEKPARPTPVPGSPDVALASMGIYIFKADVLMRVLASDATRADSQHDFGKNIIPSLYQGVLGLLVPVLRREQEGVQVLARHRNARRLLRSQHGPVPGEPGVQPVRSRSGRCARTSHRRRRRSSCLQKRGAAAARRSIQ